MTTLHITVSEEVKARVEAQAAEAGYVTVDEYVADLIKADVAVPLGAQLEAEIRAGLASPAREMTPADWDERRLRFSQRHRPGRTP